MILLQEFQTQCRQPRQRALPLSTVGLADRDHLGSFNVTPSPHVLPHQIWLL